MWVINSLFEWLSKYPHVLAKLGFCTINLSGQSLGDEKVRNLIIEGLHRHGFSGRHFCFEVTETAAISNIIDATRFMKIIKSLGCQFALDDFGSGVSSFGYLKTLPVDILKIDGLFVKDMAVNAIDHAMVKSINEIGHVMGLRTIAEFVENETILASLRESGVDFAQGHYLCFPQVLESLVEYAGPDGKRRGAAA